MKVPTLLSFLLSVAWAATVPAQVPVAVTFYKEGAGKIEGDLLADTVRSVAVAGDTVTVVQRDANTDESTLTFEVGGTPADDSITLQMLQTDIRDTLQDVLDQEQVDAGVVAGTKAEARTGGPQWQPSSQLADPSTVGAHWRR